MNLNNVSRRLFYNTFNKLTNSLPEEEKRVFPSINSLTSLIYRTKYIASHSKVEEHLCVMCNNVVVTLSFTEALFVRQKLLKRNYFPNLDSFCLQAEYDSVSFLTFNFWPSSGLRNFRFRVELDYSLPISTFKVHLTRHANKFSSFSTHMDL